MKVVTWIVTHRLEVWSTRVGALLAGVGTIEHVDWARYAGLGLIALSLGFDVGRKGISRWLGGRHSQTGGDEEKEAKD
jgi:hypothetical protein